MKGYMYKFNPASSFTEEQAKQTREYALMCKLERGEKPTVEDMAPFSELWHPDCYRTGCVKVMGWLYDFSPYFKRHLVRTKHYGWNEVRAYSKTMIRKLSSTPSWIEEIIEVA